MRLLGVAPFFLAALAGCGDLTEIVLVIQLDPALEIEAIEIELDGPNGGLPRRVTHEVSAAERPLTLALLPAGAEEGPVTVTVRALDADGTELSRTDAETSFVRGGSRMLELYVLTFCRPLAIEDPPRCRCEPDDACAPPVVAPGALAALGDIPAPYEDRDLLRLAFLDFLLPRVGNSHRIEASLLFPDGHLLPIERFPATVPTPTGGTARVAAEVVAAADALIFTLELEPDGSVVPVGPRILGGELPPDDASPEASFPVDSTGAFGLDRAAASVAFEVQDGPFGEHASVITFPAARRSLPPLPPGFVYQGFVLGPGVASGTTPFSGAEDVTHEPSLGDLTMGYSAAVAIELEHDVVPFEPFITVFEETIRDVTTPQEMTPSRRPSGDVRFEPATTAR